MLSMLKWNNLEANFGSQTSHGHAWGVYGFVLAVWWRPDGRTSAQMSPGAGPNRSIATIPYPRKPPISPRRTFGVSMASSWPPDDDLMDAPPPRCPPAPAPAQTWGSGTSATLKFWNFPHFFILPYFLLYFIILFDLLRSKIIRAYYLTPSIPKLLGHTICLPPFQNYYIGHTIWLPPFKIY